MIERNDAIKRIRKALKERSGKSWSVTGDHGTAWGWINIDAPPARRTWHFETGEDGFMVKSGTVNAAGAPEYKEFNDPTAGGGHMSPDERKELAALLNVPTVHCDGVSVSPDAREYYVLAAESKQIDLMAKFAKTCQAFQDDIKATAVKHGKTIEEVFGWWREYDQACRSGDQSAIWSEFLDWYKEKLGVPVVTPPSPIESLRELHNWMREHCGPADGVHEMLVRSHAALESAGV
jgi:hypothetical protein